jgi:phenylacetate-CoA ligase
MIRYRLNDVLRVSASPCACGSGWRVLAAVEGRSDDVLEFESASGGLRSFFPDSIRRAVLLASPAILEYEAIQEQPGHLRVHLDVVPGSESHVLNSLQDSMLEMTSGYGCRPARLELVFSLPERAANTKRRRVRRA